MRGIIGVYAACAGDDARRVLSAAADVFSARWRERDGGLQHGAQKRHHRRVCGVRGGGRAARAFRCGGGRPARRLCFGRTHTICFPGLSDHCAASSDIPARRGLTPRAASPCARIRISSAALSLRAARIHCAVLSLPAAGFFLRPPARIPCAAYPCAPRVLPASSFACAPREGRILEVSQRVPCPPRRPARASASTVQSYPCLPPVLCAASPCARIRIHCAVLSLPAAGSVCRVALRARPRPPRGPIPPCRGFCPSAAGRVDIGREPARAVPAASPCAPARVLRAA